MHTLILFNTRADRQSGAALRRAAGGAGEAARDLAAARPGPVSLRRLVLSFRYILNSIIIDITLLLPLSIILLLLKHAAARPSLIFITITIVITIAINTITTTTTTTNIILIST